MLKDLSIPHVKPKYHSDSKEDKRLWHVRRVVSYSK